MRMRILSSFDEKWIRGQNDAREAPLTAGIILGKLLFPFIVEHRQFVIVMFGDRLEIDGLPKMSLVSDYARICHNL